MHNFHIAYTRGSSSLNKDGDSPPPPHHLSTKYPSPASTSSEKWLPSAADLFSQPL